jgi:hypothetical protein
MGGGAEPGPFEERGGLSTPLPSMVCDMSFFKVKLVQEGLPIKQVVKWLSSDFKESWPTSKETASKPEGDPAWDGMRHRAWLLIATLGLSSFLITWSDCTSIPIGHPLLDFIPRAHAGQHLQGSPFTRRPDGGKCASPRVRMMGWKK